MAIAGLIFLVFLVNEVVGHTGYVARREQIRRIQDLQEQIDRLRQENQRLTQRIQDLRSNPSAIEEMAREQLNLGRPGEVVVTLPPKQAPVPSEK
ncbi:MAG: septum formation initiator family protein [Acidobacteria bacterium]|nr:septum formation initiator family protein [Acidobacteriota bacterium]